MAQIFQKIGAGIVSAALSFNFGVFTDEFWYINSVQFVNGINDVDGGSFTTDAVTYDFGSF